MHIELRKSGKNNKYYLAQSYRIGGKVKKVRIYLGANLTQRELAEKRISAEVRLRESVLKSKALRDPYLTVLSTEEIKTLEKLEPKGMVQLSHLSETDWLRFTEQFAYNTNAIEGSEIDRPEVRNILEKNEWPEKSKGEISETLGVSEAVKYLRRTKQPISISLIKKLHWIVFKNSKPFSGELRKPGEEVVIRDGFGNIAHRGAPSAEVPALLKALTAWYGRNKKRYPPLVLAIVIHNQVENIHPFRDGNGRVGRLLLINVLIKNGLPPVSIELVNREEYYSALQAYQNDRNIRPMIDLVLKEYKKQGSRHR